MKQTLGTAAALLVAMTLAGCACTQGYYDPTTGLVYGRGLQTGCHRAKNFMTRCRNKGRLAVVPFNGAPPGTCSQCGATSPIPVVPPLVSRRGRVAGRQSVQGWLQATQFPAGCTSCGQPVVSNCSSAASIQSYAPSATPMAGCSTCAGGFEVPTGTCTECGTSSVPQAPPANGCSSCSRGIPSPGTIFETPAAPSTGAVPPPPRTEPVPAPPASETSALWSSPRLTPQSPLRLPPLPSGQASQIRQVEHSRWVPRQL